MESPSNEHQRHEQPLIKDAPLSVTKKRNHSEAFETRNSEEETENETEKKGLEEAEQKKIDEARNNQESSDLERRNEASALILSASHKAGMNMTAERQAKIDAILLRESDKSEYMRQQRRRDERVNQKIEQLRSKLAAYIQNHSDWNKELTHQADLKMAKFPPHPPLSSSVVVDMDSFYISCELLDKPQFHNIPCCVGTSTSVISTSNYKAREYGVRSAMGGWVGQTLVKELSNGAETLIFFKSNFELYIQKSEQVMTILSEYDPRMWSFYLDEAYLNLEPYMALRLQLDESGEKPLYNHDQIKDMLVEKEKAFSNSENGENGIVVQSEKVPLHDKERYCEELQNVVTEMRAKVLERTGLTCSAGIGPNLMIAKIASDMKKPYGQFFVDSDKLETFLHALPTRKVPGLGRVMEKTLQAFGIKNLQDLHRDRGLLSILFQPATENFLLRASVGLSSPSSGTVGVDPEQARKGISLSRTFVTMYNLDEMLLKFQDIVTRLSHQMRQANIRAKTFTAKVKLHTFDVYCKSKTLMGGRCTNHDEEMVAIAHDLFHQVRKNHFDEAARRNVAHDLNNKTFHVRLLGMKCTNLVFDSNTKTNQPTLYNFLEKTPTSSKSIRQPSLIGKVDQGTKRKLDMSSKTSPDNQKVSSNVTQTCSFDYQSCEAIGPDNSTLAESSACASPRCPICNIKLKDSNDELNRHIDSCLNSQTVQNMIREENAAKKFDLPYIFSKYSRDSEVA